MDSETINSIEGLITRIKQDYADWRTTSIPWFRGEPESEQPLLPKLFREKNKHGQPHDELILLQRFRMKAPTLGLPYTPPRDGHTDQWLFLAQHVGLPTRLLDWTEGALVALYFAVLEAFKGKTPVVWMLNPIELNRLSLDPGQELSDNEFPLTWVRGPEDQTNIGNENFQRAWLERKRDRGVELPVAIHPTNVYPRMSSQKSCFTIHGRREEPLCDLTPAKYIRRYVVELDKPSEMLRELGMMGISYSSLFPDLDGLSRELNDVF